MSCSAKELEERVERLIELCEGSGEPPSAFTVRKVVGVSESELNELAAKGGRFQRACERLREYRTYFWLKKALDDPKYATFAAFNLKQSVNGGFSDKPSDGGGEVRVRVELSGVGGEAFM